MRAIYFPELEILESYQLTGEKLHHLVNVVRIEVGESLLLLSGQGLSVTTKVESLTKKEMRLLKLSSKIEVAAYQIDLALGMPKKEALELCLKQAVELGMRKIFLVKSDYSQMKAPDAARTQALLISALEQSNAAFLPEVVNLEWINLGLEEYGQVYLMDSQTNARPKLDRSRDFQSTKLLVIGPEGGFSPKELDFLRSRPNSRAIHLPTPLLRTPTALAAGVGVLLSSMLDG